MMLRSINATSSGYRGFGREMSFARLVLSIACVETLPVSSDLTLPDRSPAVILLQECINSVLAYYPILSDTALFGCLEACYQHKGRFSSPFDRWNVRMALAIAYLCRSSAKDDKNYLDGVAHASKALQEQDFVIHPGDVASVQAILLLVLYAALDPTHFSCYHLINMASRLLVDIGAHQECPPTIGAKKRRSDEWKLRRRLFCCNYSIDRSADIRFYNFVPANIH